MIPSPLLPRREFAPRLAEWWKGDEPPRIPASGILLGQGPWVVRAGQRPVPGVGQVFLSAEPERGVQDLADLFSEWTAEVYMRAKRALDQYGVGMHWQTSELVNEAYLRVHLSKRNTWETREHFLLYLAKVMRSILIDSYRRQRTRGGEDYRMDSSLLDQIALQVEESDVDVEGIALVLKHLAKTHPLMAEAVHLRFHQGSEMAEVARLLNISQRTLERRWSEAREWLAGQLRKSVGW